VTTGHLSHSTQHLQPEDLKNNTDESVKTKLGSKTLGPLLSTSQYEKAIWKTRDKNSTNGKKYTAPENVINCSVR